MIAVFILFVFVKIFMMKQVRYNSFLFLTCLSNLTNAQITLPLIGFIASFFVTASFGWSISTGNISNVVSLNIENAIIGQAIPPTMHGIILETNIKRDDDGGLYAELVYNRAFEGP
jgi:hypothetical protein